MSFTDFHFIRPYWLLAFVPYLLILTLMLRNKLSRGNWSAVCDAALLPYLLKDRAAKQSRWPTAFGAIAALTAILALAGPSWKKLPSPVFRNDSALVIALDLSRSMDAEDLKPSRLIRSRYKIADMLRQRKDGQTALLVYAGEAFTVTPLTNDNETIASQLEALTTDIMPVPGKNTAAVLNKAAELFKQAGQQKGQIVLITDGVDVDKTLGTVRALGNYSLSILGVGTPEGAPIALPAGGFLKDGQGTIVIPKLNEGDLTKLASAGNGIYRSLTADDADIRALLANAGRAEPSKQENGDNQLVLDLWEDQGPYLLLLVLPLAALFFRKGLLGVALLLVLPFPEPSYALAWNDLWLTRNQQAAKAYEQGQYDRAAELFENPDWKLAAQYKANQPASEKMPTPESATGFYNQGNVLAKSGRLEEAVAAYKKSLEIDPANEDARFNKDLVEKELEKRKKQQEQNQDQQQQDNQQQAKDKDSPEQKKQDGEPERNKEGKKEEGENASDQADSNSEQSNENREASKEHQQNKSGEQPPTENNPQAERNPEGKNEPEEGQSQQPVNGAQPTDEQQQANEQWLNRIPDDPAGLLKRKFKYQYGQRQRQ